MGLEIEIGIETSPGVNSQMFAAATLAAAAAEAEPRSDHSVRERERERECGQSGARAMSSAAAKVAAFISEARHS